ncbi:hypothetical protein ACFS3C_17035 [Azotobacter vinelandii]
MGFAGLDKPACPPYKKAASRRASLPAVESLPPARESRRSPRIFLVLSRGSGFVRKKKPLDPVRQAQKNRAYRIGYLIALAGIACGFMLLELKSV